MSDASPDVVLQNELTNASVVDLRQAVVDLFDAHHQAIFGYLYRMTGRERELAEELTQETFLKAFQARDQLPRIVNHRAWLYRIATNLALNARKRRSRFRWLPWSRAPEAQTSVDVLQGAEIRLDLERALDRLSPSLRAPLLLSAVQELRGREIAEALGISEGAVRTRLYRSREQLRAIFQEDV